MTCDLPSPELSIHSRWILAYVHRFIPRNVQSISIHNRQWITKILSMGKLKILTYPHNGILYSSENKWTVTKQKVKNCSSKIWNNIEF